MAQRSSHLSCTRTTWQGRRGYAIGNGIVALTALCGGGHISEMRLAGLDLSPLWVAPWPTIEPYDYVEDVHAHLYGTTAEGKLLSGLAGHNVCLDYFGNPSEEEAALGLSRHGEAPSSKWRATNRSVSRHRAALEMSVRLPVAGLDFSRRLTVKAGQPIVYYTETVRNLRRADHFFHWTQHVTFDPRFLDPESSSVAIPGDKAITYPHGYDEGKALLASGHDFVWPGAPLARGGTIDLSRPFSQKGLGFVVAVSLRQDRDIAFIAGMNTALGLVMTYCFKRTDFPWVAVWEENQGIAAVPWRERTRARGLEFSTTPLPVTRRESHMSGHLLGQPTQTFIPARGTKPVNYIALLSRVPSTFSQLCDVSVEREIVLKGASPSERIVVRAPDVRSHFG